MNSNELKIRQEKNHPEKKKGEWFCHADTFLLLSSERNHIGARGEPVVS